MSKRKKILVALFAVILGAQFVPLPRDNPPIRRDIEAPANIKTLLHAACYDCHSNETKWPWYAWVAPASWLLVYDIQEGREHLNFSEWDLLTDVKDLAHKYEEIAEEVEEGEMPLAIYPPLHPEARLTPSQRQTIVAWAEAMHDATLAPSVP